MISDDLLSAHENVVTDTDAHAKLSKLINYSIPINVSVNPLAYSIGEFIANLLL